MYRLIAEKIILEVFVLTLRALFFFLVGLDYGPPPLNQVKYWIPTHVIKDSLTVGWGSGRIWDLP